jgi:hypothetical protein
MCSFIFILEGLQVKEFRLATSRKSEKQGDLKSEKGAGR